MKNYLNDAELEELKRNPEYQVWVKGGKKCPVCDGDGHSPGTYRSEGVEHVCPQTDYGHEMIQRSKLYWLHNIPHQYQQLPPFADKATPERQEIRTELDEYIADYHYHAKNGVGLTFYSKINGTGKTWAATYVLKELVKLGYDGWFAPFYDVKSYWEIEDRDERKFKIQKVRESGLLVLDEVVPAVSQRQRDLFAEKLETLIRPRQDMNFPTIITTNLTPDEIEKEYPRSFSLLSAKNLSVGMPGEDHRLGGGLWLRNAEVGANREVWPIT